MTAGPLEGRRAVVTGSGRGLGRAIALALAEAGADIALAGRVPDSLEQVAKEIRELGRRAVTQATDVTDVAQVERLMDVAETELGGIDVLVNNSGIVVSSPLLTMSDAQWDAVIDTNLRGVFLCTRAAGRRLVKSGGKVINVASTWAFKGVSQHSSYCASKAAVVAFTRAMAVEWARYGVQVNAIAPGYFETDINGDIRARPDLRERIVREIPAGRMGRPHEIAMLAVLLAGPGSDFMTGETVVLDGGLGVR